MTKPQRVTYNWQDPLLFSEQLSEEERLIQDNARSFAEEHLQPNVLRDFREEHFDRQLMVEMGNAGLLGATIEGYGCAVLTTSLTA